LWERVPIEMSERLSARISADKLQLLAATFVLRQMLEERKDIDGETRKRFSQLLNTKFGELTLAKLAPVAKAVGASLDMLRPDNVERLARIIGITDEQEKERLAKCLAEGIPHNVLNAKYHEKEAQIIAEAGRLGAVTIATNMAGRGVDIILGGKPEGSTSERNPEAEEVVRLGGLFIIGTERHESRRIDNQLRGRAGRQGDPGESRFYVSMEDELMRVFGDKSQSALLSGWQEELAIPSKLMSKVIERTQKKMEAHYFEIRKHVLQYDDVMNVQREVIYGQRRKILEGVDLKPTIIDYLHKVIANNVAVYCPEGVHPREWDTDTLFEVLNDIFPLEVYARPSDLRGKNRQDLIEFLCTIADRTYEDREKEIGTELMRDIERQIALRAINNKWMEHLDAMDYLREGIGLRGYAQIDPLVAYKKEAFMMFEEMLQSIQDEIVRLVYRVQVRQEIQPFRSPYRNIQMHSGGFVPPGSVDQTLEGAKPGSPVSSRTPVQVKKKIGRNDPCPCGSGKKFKKCCLREES
jgi:preprotein translocase subunit SecA